MAINLPLQNQSFYVMNVIGKPAATSHTMCISIIITLMFLPYNLNIISDTFFTDYLHNTLYWKLLLYFSSSTLACIFIST